MVVPLSENVRLTSGTSGEAVYIQIFLFSGFNEFSSFTFLFDKPSWLLSDHVQHITKSSLQIERFKMSLLGISES